MTKSNTQQNNSMEQRKKEQSAVSKQNIGSADDKKLRGPDRPST